eukprot:5805075-Pleurochrysis_carterae.AAC.1
MRPKPRLTADGRRAHVKPRSERLVLGGGVRVASERVLLALAIAFGSDDAPPARGGAHPQLLIHLPAAKGASWHRRQHAMAHTLIKDCRVLLSGQILLSRLADGIQSMSADCAMQVL